MHDCFEVVPRRGIAEHDRAELGAVHRSVGCEDVGAKARGNRCGRLGARGFDPVNQLVGVETRDVEAAESIENVRLPRRDSSGECDLQHQITVRLNTDATETMSAPPDLPVLPGAALQTATALATIPAAVAGPRRNQRVL